MVRPAGREGNEMVFTTELTLGAAILPTTSSVIIIIKFVAPFFAKAHQFHQFNTLDAIIAELFELLNSFPNQRSTFFHGRFSMAASAVVESNKLD